MLPDQHRQYRCANKTRVGHRCTHRQYPRFGQTALKIFAIQEKSQSKDNQ